MSCEGARTFRWLRGSPPVRTLFFGSLAALARGSLAALHLLLSAVGSVFSKNCGAPSQLKKCQNLGPLALQQDMDIYIYIYIFPIKVHRGRGQNFPIFIFCRYLVELGPRQLGLPVADSSFSGFQKFGLVSMFGGIFCGDSASGHLGAL